MTEAIKDEPTRVKAWFGRKRGSEKVHFDVVIGLFRFLVVVWVV